MKLLLPYLMICVLVDQSLVAQTNDAFLLLRLTPKDVIVSNHVSFASERADGELPHDMLQFSVTVCNLSTNLLPNLNPMNVVRYMKCFVDGKSVATGAEFGGMHDPRGKAVLRRGDSDTHCRGEWLTGSSHWPDNFSIQWTSLLSGLKPL